MSGHQHQATIAATPRRLAAEAAIAFDGEAGAALHRRRRRLGLTATEVGRRVGITQRQMARLELGLGPLTLAGPRLGAGWAASGCSSASKPPHARPIGVDLAATMNVASPGAAPRRETGSHHDKPKAGGICGHLARIRPG